MLINIQMSALNASEHTHRRDALGSDVIQSEVGVGEGVNEDPCRR